MAALTSPNSKVSFIHIVTSAGRGAWKAQCSASY